MSIDLTAREVEYANAWALAIESATPTDRRLTSIFAMTALGNAPVVRCAAHGMPRDLPMTFSETYQHVVSAPSRCKLSADVKATR